MVTLCHLFVPNQPLFTEFRNIKAAIPAKTKKLNKYIDLGISFLNKTNKPFKIH